ncbi:hypothetical protein GCM10023067_50720 [Aminobacter aganoensis]
MTTSLRQFADHFLAEPEGTRDYAEAAKVLLQAILEGSEDTDWPEEVRHAFFHAVILGELATNTSSQFVARLAEAHSANLSHVMPTVARRLDPFLREAWSQKPLPKSAVLLFLQLRHLLGPWLDQAELSRTHLEALPEFTLADMALPYNSMFDPVSFARNVADVASLKQEDMDRFRLFQVVLFNWITGQDFEIGQGAIDDALAGRGREQDLAAAKSLSHRRARHGNAVSTPRLKLMQAKPYQAFHAAKAVLRGRFKVPGRRKPRVAVCISGQLRGFRKAFPSLQQFLLPGTDHEIFVDTWQDIGRSGAEPFRKVLPFAGVHFAEAYREHCTRVGVEEMRCRYASLFAKLASTGMITAGEVGAFFGTDNVYVEDDKAERFSAFSNSAKMHYKISACASQVEASGKEFDLVLRIRPDKPVTMVGFGWPDVQAVCRTGSLLFADQGFGHQYARLLVGDQMAVGSPQAMRIYASTFEAYPGYAEQGFLQCAPGLHGHSSLAQTCWLNGIDVERLAIRFAPLAETEPLSTRDIMMTIEQDSTGRMDAVDMALMNATRRDLLG